MLHPPVLYRQQICLKTSCCPGLQGSLAEYRASKTREFRTTQAKMPVAPWQTHSHCPQRLTLQRISFPRNATKWGVARFQFRGLKNRQPIETVARLFPAFFTAFFLFLFDF